MSIVKTGTDIGAGVRDVLGTGDDYYLTEEAVVGSTDSDAIAATSLYDIFIAGEVYGDRAGIDVGANSGDISIMPTGSVTGRAYGINSDGVSMDLVVDGYVHGGVVGILKNGGGGTTITVTGTVSSSSNSAMTIEGNVINILNHGLITNAGGGNATDTIEMRDDTGGRYEIVNFGEIASAGDYAIDTDLDGFADIQNFSRIGGRVDLTDTSDRVVNGGVITHDVALREGDNFFDGAGGRVTGEISAELGDDWIRGGDFIDRIRTGDGDDTLIGRGDDDRLEAGAGGDALRGGAGDDTLLAEAGFDTLRGGAGRDTADGSFGNDLIFGGDGNDRLTAGLGRDEVWGGDGDDTLLGEGSDDILRGGAGNDTLDGGTENDDLHGGEGHDTLTGFTANDDLKGGAGDDSLDGGLQDDRLTGGAGDDTLAGGFGDDTFVFAPDSGDDTITDFVQGEDVIDVTAYPFFNFWKDVRPYLLDDGTDLVVDLSFGDRGTTITLEGLSGTFLTGADILA